MAARVRDVVWAATARDALDEVIEYIARDSRSAAVQLLEEALQSAARLDMFPERGRIVPELNDPAIREVFVFRYRLLYEVGESRVTWSRSFMALAISRRGVGIRTSYSPTSGPRGVT